MWVAVRVFVVLVLVLGINARAQKMSATPGMIYVSPLGNDAWTGRFPAPSADGTDGPCATLGRARMLVREQKVSGQCRVILRQGTYFLEQPLELKAEDSGTEKAPVVYTAAEGERVIVSGGRPLAGWKQEKDGLWSASVPGDWEFRQMRVGDESCRLARYPNFDSDNPTTGGWLFARSETLNTDWFTSVANIHNPGDSIRWEIEVPVAGSYRLWLYYGQKMKPHGRDNNDGKMSVSVDGGKEVMLQNLPDTGSWSKFDWSHSATLDLPQGKHSLTWKNCQGGGINLNALALCNSSEWKPVGNQLASPGEGKQLVVVQAQKYVEAKGRELKVTASSSYGARKDELPFGKGDIPEWDLSGAQIQIFPAWGWVGGKVQIGGIDRKAGILKLTGKNVQQEIRLGNRYYLENVREALDQPGEFYLDRQAGRVFYYPRHKEFSGEGVVVPRLDRLVHLQGAEHVQFRNIEFRDARYSTEVETLYCPDDAAIWVENSRDIAIEYCAFTLLGGYGVKFVNRSRNCRIIRCSMSEMGQGGVIARGDNTDQAEQVTVAACRMYNLGRFYQHVAGVYVTTGKHFRVVHCDIHDVPRYAISFKSYNAKASSHHCVAEYNDIWRTNLETNDTGAIETLGRDHKLTGNIIRYNRILDTIGMKHTPDGKLLSPFYTWGIYLDDYSSGTTIYGNIVARNYRGGYHNHLGFDNVVENNIFVDGYKQQAEWNGRADMLRNTFSNNIVVYSDPESAYLRFSGGRPDIFSECDRNLIWWTGGDLEQGEKVTSAGSWEAWRKLGMETNSLIADPGFVDAAKDDYRLTPDSPAWKLGFKRIPVEKIGVKGYENP